MRYSVLQAIGILALGLAAAGSARADNLYTFDSPQFLPGELTPIGPTAPNFGDPTFTTSFASSADPGGATIASGFPDSLFSGAFLVTESPGPLTLTFSQPVSGLSVDFGLDAPVGDPAAYLELVTASGTVDQLNMAAGGGPFADGVLDFTTATPFTTATLDAFVAPGSETLFAIDNLDLAVVPEPPSLTLLGSGLAGFMALILRRRQESVV